MKPKTIFYILTVIAFVGGVVFFVVGAQLGPENREVLVTFPDDSGQTMGRMISAQEYEQFLEDCAYMGLSVGRELRKVRAAREAAEAVRSRWGIAGVATLFIGFGFLITGAVASDREWGERRHDDGQEKMFGTFKLTRSERSKPNIDSRGPSAS